MKNSQQPQNGDSRQRQLEALFADEPFLSPTMKARRLHEKLQELRAEEPVATERTPKRTRESNLPFWNEDEEAPAFLRPERKPGSEARMSFAEATAYLRRSAASSADLISPPDRLSHFRTQVLPQWL